MANSIELDKETKEKLLEKSDKCGMDPSELLNKYVTEGLKNDEIEEKRKAKRKKFKERMKKYPPLLEDWEVAQKRGYTPEELDKLFEELSDPEGKPQRLDPAVWGIEIDEKIDGEKLKNGASK